MYQRSLSTAGRHWRRSHRAQYQRQITYWNSIPAGSKLKHRTRTTRVKGIGSGYWRVVGEVDELIDKDNEISQCTLRWYSRLLIFSQKHLVS